MSAALSAATVTSAARRRRERTGVQRERHQPAYPLLVAVIGLVAAGVVMVYSASSVRAYFSNDDPATYGIQQLMWAGVGLSAMYVASRMDFRWLRYLSIPAYLGSMALLAAVLVPGIGTEIAGSRRWALPAPPSDTPSSSDRSLQRRRRDSNPWTVARRRFSKPSDGFPSLRSALPRTLAGSC